MDDSREGQDKTYLDGGKLNNFAVEPLLTLASDPPVGEHPLRMHLRPRCSPTACQVFGRMREWVSEWMSERVSE